MDRALGIVAAFYLCILPRLSAGEPQTISWMAPTNEVLSLNLAYPLKAASSSGLAVSFQVATGPAFIQGTNLVITNRGTVWIKATQEGNDTFAATNLARSFNAARFMFTPLSTNRFYARSLALGQSNIVHVADLTKGLKSFDVTDPRNPQQVGSFEMPDWIARKVAVDRGLVCGATETKGLQILNVDNPANPRVVGVVPRETLGYVSDFVVDGAKAYAVGANGVFIVDISDPAQPTILSSVRTLLSPFAVGKSGSRLFLSPFFTNGLSYTLRIFDVADAYNPIMIGSLRRARDDSGDVLQMVVQDAHCYGTKFTEGFRIYNISDPSSPQLLHSSTGAVYGINISGSHVYLGRDGGFAVLDVSNPSLPLLVGEHGRRGPTWAIEKRDKLLFVPAGNGGFQIVEERSGLPQTITVQLPETITSWTSPLPLDGYTSSDLPIRWSVLRGPGIISDSKLLPTGNGEIVIRAEQDGNSEYLPAMMERTITVSSPAPELRVSRTGSSEITLEWSTPHPGWALFELNGLDSDPSWKPVDKEPLHESGKFSLTLPMVERSAYFKLIFSDQHPSASR